MYYEIDTKKKKINLKTKDYFRNRINRQEQYNVRCERTRNQVFRVVREIELSSNSGAEPNLN